MTLCIKTHNLTSKEVPDFFSMNSLNHDSNPKILNTGTISPISQMKKQRLRVVTLTTESGESSDWISALLTPKPVLF